MNRSKTDYYEIDLLRLAGALWKKLWLIVLVTLLCGALAFGYTFFLVTPLYKATAMMYVNNSAISVGSAKVSISAGDLAASQSLVDTYTVILKTRGTLNEVISRTGVPYSYQQLTKMVQAEAVNSTEVFSIDVTSPDPQEAELIANAIADILPDRARSRSSTTRSFRRKSPLRATRAIRRSVCWRVLWSSQQSSACARFSTRSFTARMISRSAISCRFWRLSRIWRIRAPVRTAVTMSPPKRRRQLEQECT